jgi:outer membrane protein TolC
MGYFSLDKYKIEEKSLRDLEIQVEKGYKTRLELLQQENKYHITLLALKKIEDNYQQLTRDFETKIGLEPGELGIELKDIATPTPWSLNEEEAIVLALKNSLTLQALTLETELAKIDLERAKIGPLLALEQKKLENNLELALLNQEQSRAEVKRVVGNQYASLRQVEEELALNRTHLEIVKKNYQLVQQLQAADLISLLDQISAEVELLQAEYQMRVAITGFYLEKWKLQQLIGLELEV